jgi:hypothetical protein
MALESTEEIKRIDHKTDNVVPFPHRPQLPRRSRAAAGIDDLALLEAENALLRNYVINLALEIQEERQRILRSSDYGLVYHRSIADDQEPGGLFEI